MVYKCFRCGRVLHPSMGDMHDETPFGAVIFHTEGNYGSMVFDPVMSGPTLLIAICDECILLHRDLINAREALRSVEYSYRPWKPGDWEGSWSQEEIDSTLREVRQRLAEEALKRPS